MRHNPPRIPSQYGDAEILYNKIKTEYPNATIETTGYSLGATISNLLSHRTGIPSVAIAPIGSKHIVNYYKKYFTYDDSNITTFGRMGESLFYKTLNRQSGEIYIVPDLTKNDGVKHLSGIQNHLLHRYDNEKLNQSKPYVKSHSTGYAANIDNPAFTPEEIGRMSTDEFLQNESVIMKQLENGQIRNSAPRIDYNGFKNPQTGSPKIFTREDVEKMSSDEYLANENEIMAQMKTIGIPFKRDLPEHIPTYEKQKSYKASPENGRWVTINGNHVFIED